MPYSRNLTKMILALPTTPHPKTHDPVVAGFAVLIEMHQDHDGALPQFRHSFVRGECAPIAVDLDPNTMDLIDVTGSAIPVDYHHQRFLSVEQWSNFLMDYIMSMGTSPIINGTMPTRLLRDARASRNLLRSFRQMVVHNAKKGVKTASHP